MSDPEAESETLVATSLSRALWLLHHRSGLTYKAMAAKCGMSPAQVSSYIRGLKTPEMEELARLAEVYAAETAADLANTWAWLLAQAMTDAAQKMSPEMQEWAKPAAEQAAKGLLVPKDRPPPLDPPSTKEQQLIAIHEAGHFVAAVVLGRRAIGVSATAHGEWGGKMWTGLAWGTSRGPDRRLDS